jgi:hypothetical protein
MNTRVFARLMALSAAPLLGSCGFVVTVGAGGTVVSGTVGAATGTSVPVATEYRLGLVRYSLFGPGANQLEAAEFLTPIAIGGGVGAFAAGLPPSVDLGSEGTKGFYRVVVYDDAVDDDTYDQRADGTGVEDRVLADSANGRAEGGDRSLVYVTDHQEYAPGKTLVRGWNLITDPNRDTNLAVAFGTSDDTVSQTLTGVRITY